jgi:hypothetical protein
VYWDAGEKAALSRPKKPLLGLAVPFTMVILDSINAKKGVFLTGIISSC